MPNTEQRRNSEEEVPFGVSGRVTPWYITAFPLELPFAFKEGTALDSIPISALRVSLVLA
jgi:hypothetical protein